MQTFPEVRHVSVSIARPPEAVYAFAAEVENLPRWAAGLAVATVRRSGDDLIAESPMGRVKVRFVGRNEYGVLDHDVTLPSGDVNHNPMRVLRNGGGSEVVFTLFRRPGVTAEQFATDTAAVERDLAALKALLERR